MSNRNERLRVLISAYGCRPGTGSEFGVGWNQVEQSARFHDVWVVTRKAHRQAIEAELKIRPIPGVRWEYFDLPGCARTWKYIFLVRAYYYLWQLTAYFVARRLHRRIQFHVAHHVTFVSYSSPTFLAFLPVPFIWGPVGGGESAPRAFRKGFGARGRSLEILRDLARDLGEFDPLVRIGARHSALALGTTRETEQRLTKLGCRNTAVMPAVGLPATELAALGMIPLPDSERPFRIFTVGRLLYWKGQELALRAYARFRQEFPESEYWIIGEGPDRTRLEKLSRSLGLGAGSVTFLGRKSRSQVFDTMALCHVMLFPSLHDSGGWVSLEAMAARRPIVCLDLGGPALQVTQDVGVKVSPLNPEQAIAELAEALKTLAGNPARRLRLGECGRARVVHHFNWDRKGEEFAALYSSLARGNGPVRSLSSAATSPTASTASL